MPDTPNLEELLALAEAASGGEWSYAFHPDGIKLSARPERKLETVATVYWEPNAAYIAAMSPDTTKALVGMIRELQAENAKLARQSTDRLYMLTAYRQMLGPTGLKVAAMWDDKNVSRVHFDWGPEAHKLTGEERAQVILDMEAAPRRKLDFVDSNRIAVDRFVEGGPKPPTELTEAK